MPVSLPLTRPARASIDQQSFRDAMASMAASVSLVTAEDGGVRLGRTVTAAMSLALDPPSIVVSIDIISPLVDVITRAGGFSFAVLAQDQEALAEAFAGRVAAERRFDGGHWSQWSSGQPRLAGAVISADCELIGSIETGKSVLFAGALVEIDTDLLKPPLVWHHRRYGTVNVGPPVTRGNEGDGPLQ